jgi:3-isopropylmalate dehydrogenase
VSRTREIDFVVVREGTEGLYCGNGGVVRTGTPHEIATEVSVNTAYGVERVVRDAFERAARAGTSSPWCTSTTCWSTPAACGTGSSTAVAPSIPQVSTDYLHVDAATIFLATDPARFDVIVTDNLFGDILTDLAAAVTGGIGWPRAATSTRPDRPVDVRAGARLRPGHRRPGHRRPDRDHPVGGSAA